MQNIATADAGLELAMQELEMLDAPVDGSEAGGVLLITITLLTIT